MRNMSNLVTSVAITHQVSNLIGLESLWRTGSQANIFLYFKMNLVDLRCFPIAVQIRPSWCSGFIIKILTQENLFVFIIASKKLSKTNTSAPGGENIDFAEKAVSMIVVKTLGYGLETNRTKCLHFWSWGN